MCFNFKGCKHFLCVIYTHSSSTVWLSNSPSWSIIPPSKSFVSIVEFLSFLNLSSSKSITFRFRYSIIWSFSLFIFLNSSSSPTCPLFFTSFASLLISVLLTSWWNLLLTFNIKQFLPYLILLLYLWIFSETREVL